MEHAGREVGGGEVSTELVAACDGRDDPEHGREHAVGLLLRSGTPVLHVLLTLRDDAGGVLGRSVDLDEVPVFVFHRSDGDVEVRAEGELLSVRPKVGTPAGGLALDHQRAIRVVVSEGLGDDDTGLGDGEEMLQERGRGQVRA